MIDLSFLTEEEQEAIMKVLQRDAELKRAEEERVRHLPEKIKDDVQLKNMSGQWFYEAKSKRHRDKIHGADIIRASMRRRPATIVAQNKTSKAKISWVNNVNKEVIVPPDLHSIVEHQEQQQLKTTLLCLTEILSLSEESPTKSNLQNDETEKPKKPSAKLTDESQNEVIKRPVPKVRKLIPKAADSGSHKEDFVPQPTKETERINGIGTPPRGILKRSSSSSSTDSEVRVSQMLDVQRKNGLSTATIFEREGEKSSIAEAEDSTQNSLEKLKQVRFSSSPGEGKPLQSAQLHHGKERAEHDLLKPNQKKSGNHAVQSDSLGDKQISGTAEVEAEGKAYEHDGELLQGIEEVTARSVLSNTEYRGSDVNFQNLPEEKPVVGASLTCLKWPVCVCSVHVFCLITGSEEELNPVLMALKRSADRKKPSKSLEDIPSATSSEHKACVCVSHDPQFGLNVFILVFHTALPSHGFVFVSQ
uniref:RabBD domain-containing protein n=1 Tax=Malurus cyaneus samueli TaxID=2593467 RepID=A0A8C5TNP3_9PASS